MTDPTAGEIVDQEHRLAVRVYYEDTDFSGIVYHANYLRFFERGRTDFLRLCGVSHSALLARPDPLALAVTRMEVDWKRAARIDDALTIITAYEAVRGVRLLLRQRIVRGEDLIAQASVEAVCISPDGRVRRPPADMVEALGPFLPAP